MCVDTLAHQMKGLENGKQDVRRSLPNMGESLSKQNDEVRYSEYIHNMLILC